MQRLTWMAGAAALGICIGGTALAADTSGWAVRICRGETEASAMKITISDGKTKKVLVNWQSDNEETNFPVPAPVAMAKTLTINADSEPPDGKVVLCVLWDHGVAKTMRFNDLMTDKVSQGEKDEHCPCR